MKRKEFIKELHALVATSLGLPRPGARRGTSANSKPTNHLGTVGAGPYYDTTAIAWTTYYYWVRAVDGCGVGPFSAYAIGYLEPPG